MKETVNTTKMRASRRAAPQRCSVPDPYGYGRCRRKKGHDGWHTQWWAGMGTEIRFIICLGISMFSHTLPSEGLLAILEVRNEPCN